MLSSRTQRFVLGIFLPCAMMGAALGCGTEDLPPRQPHGNTGETGGGIDGTNGTDSSTSATGTGGTAGTTASSAGMTTTGSSSASVPPWELPEVDLITKSATCTPGQVRTGQAPLRRISRVEYDNMVRDLLGDTTQPAKGFVSETKVAGFNSNADTASHVNPLINCKRCNSRGST
jgi:hypothetical protein